MLAPLIDPPLPVAPPSRFERACMFVPILGWIIACYLDSARRRPRANHIAEQIAARAEPTAAAWGDDPDRRAAAAVAVCEAIMNEFGWPNANYLPEDRVDLLMCGTGGEVLFCLAEIGIRLSKRVFGTGVGLGIMNMTLGQFVDCVISLPRQRWR